jgi:hypothetical protein
LEDRDAKNKLRVRVERALKALAVCFDSNEPNGEVDSSGNLLDGI